MAKKKINLLLTEQDLLRPFWVDLPMPFYERVKKAALEFGISQKELIPRAVDDFIQEQRKEKRELTSGKCEGAIAIEWSPEQAWETPTSAAGA